MTPEHHRRVGQLFRDALELPAGERPSFLSRSCGVDGALKNEVESLLSYEAAGHTVIDGSALEVVGRAIAAEQSHSWVGRQVSHYRIVSRLGGGGMGEVYRARDSRLERDVAIKALPFTYAADGARLKRFEEEARSVGQLNHPNVVVVHDVGVHDGAPFIVTEPSSSLTMNEQLLRESWILLAAGSWRSRQVARRTIFKRFTSRLERCPSSWRRPLGSIWRASRPTVLHPEPARLFEVPIQGLLPEEWNYMP